MRGKDWQSVTYLAQEVSKRNKSEKIGQKLGKMFNNNEHYISNFSFL